MQTLNWRRTDCVRAIAQVGEHETHVFSYEGKPIKQVNTKAWYKVLKRAGNRELSLA